MHWTIVGHVDITIGRDGQLLALLGISIDIDDELVARPQHIVLRGGNVHHGFEGKTLVVEDITTEDLLATLLGSAEIKGVGTLVHGHIVAIKPTVGTVHHHLLLTHLLSLRVHIDLTESSIVLAHPVGGVANGSVGSLTHTGLLELTGILLTHLLDLFQRGTFLEQLLSDIALGLTQFLLLHDVLQNLSITHALGKCRTKEAA